MKKKLKSKIKKYDFILMLLIGFWLLFFVFFKYYKGIVSENWPTTKGVVTSSFVEKVLRESSSGTKVKENLKIEFDYFLENQKYHSTNFGNIEGLLQNIVEKYPIGKNIKVYYNPDNPMEAILNPGFSLGTSYIMFIIIGFLITLIGFYEAYIKTKKFFKYK